MHIFFEPKSSLEKVIINLISRIRFGKTISIKTSGTTGIPKIIKKKIDVQCLFQFMDEKWLLCYDPRRWSGISVITHVMKIGAELYVPKTFDPKDTIDCAFNNKVTHISITPSLFKILVMNDHAGKLRTIPLKQLTFGGEAVTQSAINLAQHTFPLCRITHVYASSETGDICAISDGMSGIPSYKFKDYSFSADQELIVNGHNTGDIWQLNGERYQFQGRKQEIINVGGVKVSPIFVENEVLKLGLFHAKCYAIRSPITGNLVCIEYMGNISEHDLQNKLKNILTKYEMPAKIIRKYSIEVTEAGKLKR